MIPFVKGFSYLHLNSLDDLEPDETEVKGIVPSPRMPRKFLSQTEIENLMKNLDEENFDDSDSEFEDEFENSILENNEIELDVSANFDEESDGLFSWKEVEGSEMINVLPFSSKVGLKVDAISFKTENDFF
ncbi:uncharacterized protein TNCV_4441801 [Trichonephila clavipes]|nr:uncharacterized protein TNCV_4441801 [Trichonephila clavipes]